MNFDAKTRGVEVKGGLRAFGAGACAVAMLVTMGCWGETQPSSSQPSATVAGKVVQGEVSGATVFADRLDNGVRGVLDGDEVSTITDAHGNFELHPTYTNYVIVSTGGTDTITNQKAIPMMAPAGAKNISPLTTLVALNPGMKTRIEALGVSYDADMSSSVTPAALLLAKSVETTVQSFSDAIKKQGTVSAAEVGNIQLQVLSSLASKMSAAGVTPATLSTPAELQAVVSSAVTDAISTVQTTNGNVAVSDQAAFAAGISNTVTGVASAINPAATGSTSFSTSASSATSESSQLNVVTVLNTVNTATNQAATTVTITPDLIPPVMVSHTPTASSVINGGTFTAVYNEALDPTTVNTANVTLSYSGGKVPGVVTYDPLTRTITFTASAPLLTNTTYTATISNNVTDLSGNYGGTVSWLFTNILSGSTGTTSF